MSFETIDQVIRSRRSVFPPHYVSRPLSKETISELLECANNAPTHRITQPWRFTVFTGAGLEKLADFLAEHYRSTTTPETFSPAKYEVARDKVLKSGAVIAINVQLHPHLLPEWEEIASTAAAVQSLWLSAWEKGIGGYWSSPGNVLGPLAAFLDLPENQKNIGLFYMGYHNAPELPARRTPVEEKTTWIEG